MALTTQAPTAPATDTAPAPAPAPTGPLTRHLPPHDGPAIAAAAAHQVRSPLASIRLRLELLQDQLSKTEARREVRGILAEVQRLGRILEQLLTWGSIDRRESPAENVDPLGAAARSIDAWSPLADTHDVRLVLHGLACTATQVPGALEQSLDVLLDNALHVSPDGSAIHLTVRRTATTVRTEVADRGPGMTREEMARACEPFWRGGSSRKPGGTGLGLTIAAALLTASGGHLELDARDGGGLLAVAVLPVAA
ncbi:sensor histidine kinase [Streptomyces beihaiensis]|uniref:histidine kinase n=1 Tax=Streptomyces beihaiensis TaxID=2984495 RepID=A0ABT3TWE2_9ACTN|nr:HAMP domain-containing sensor histidine kinase [Streptomyces beihaiensis]MCX3061376.1 HAMP domain-containing histidine kinase [Streptomyces beihaiensis]